MRTLEHPSRPAILDEVQPDTDEETLYEANPVMFRNNPIGFILTILGCAVGIGFIIFVIWALQTKCTKITVTSRRTVLRRGILSKSLNEVWHRDLRSVGMRQTILQRMLGVGQLDLSTAGQSGIEISVSGIRWPERVKELIQQRRLESRN